MRYVESLLFGLVLNRVSAEERRLTVKPNGVVLWRLKIRSDSGGESGGEKGGEWWFSGRKRCGEVCGCRGRTSSGISQRERLVSVILTLKRSFVSKLAVRDKI